MQKIAISAAALVLGLGPVSVASEVQVDPALIAEGTSLYMEHCSVCHGNEGDGRGPLASGFSPAPRDFTRGSFKIQTTNVEDPPHETDLMKTIRTGISGSYGQSMPSFDFLNEREVRSLAEVIRFLAAIDEFGTPVPVPPRPRRADIAKGQALYEELNCAACHGDNGDGRGMLADELEDDNGHPIKPADFRVGQFKGGNTPEDLWMRIYTGISGTPMPAFGRNSSDADIWAVTEYILTFSK